MHVYTVKLYIHFIKSVINLYTF